MSDPSRNSFDLSPQRRALLERMLRESQLGGAGSDTIQHRLSSGLAPLSFPQQRLWFLDQLAPGPTYNIPVAMHLSGLLDPEALAGGIAAIVARHEVLRTTFAIVDGQPVQIVATAPAPALPLVNLQPLPPAEREAEARRLTREQARQTFDLAHGPLLRARLLRLGEDEHILLLTLHHIAADDWSIGVFLQELAQAYPALAAGQLAPLPDLLLQYSDFAAWQCEQTGDADKIHLDYWRRQLASHLPVLALPTDRPRPPMQTYAGATESIEFGRPLTDALRAFSQQERTTLFMLLLAGFQVLLHRYTGQDDILIGTPVAGRTRREVEGLIGCFANMLVMRGSLAGDPPFRMLLQRVRDMALDAYSHQDLPFERLVEVLQPARDLSRHPLFQVAIQLLGASPEMSDLGGLRARREYVFTETAKFDLFLILEETAHGLRATIEYNSDLFDAATIACMLDAYRTLLAGAMAFPDQTISALPLLSPEVAEKMLRGWNATALEIEAGSLPGWIEAQARRTPGAIAVVGEGGQLTYGELEAQASRLAQYLHAQGVARGSLVAIALDRSPSLLVGLLGVLKAGAAYLPLDLTYPPQRLAHILADARPRALLTQPALRAQHFAPGPANGSGPAGHLQLDPSVAVVLLDEVLARPVPDDAVPLPTVELDDLAYVIYTSGSTGVPKGVAIPHGALANCLGGLRATLGVQAHDRLLAITTLAFDIAGLELWLPLCVGAVVELGGPAEAADGVRLAARLKRSAATILQATPTTWRLLLAGGWAGDPGLKALCGGEPLPRSLADGLLGRVGELWNLYGPTETTIWSTAEKVEAGSEPVSIGRPIANTQVYVLDGQGQPAPVGVVGELTIGGRGLAAGYWGQPELTAARFVPDRIGASGGRLYRTGDRGRWRADGKLECLGRVDQQVKLRGHRIELGEVEAVLGQHRAVAQAVAAIWDGGDADQRLVAYVVLATRGNSSAERTPAGVRLEPQLQAELRAFLKERLPDYMLPATFVALPSIPLTLNGKIDRKALPAAFTAAASSQASLLPGRLAQTIAAIWKDVLHLEQIESDQTFFDLGGHSLLLARVRALLLERLGLDISLVELFKYPTVGTLARFLEEQHRIHTAEPVVRHDEPRATPDSTSTPIAIVGMAGRFPGAPTIEAFWRNLCEGVESVQFFSDDELLAARVDPQVLRQPNYVRARAALDGIDLFDAPFFGYSAREAELMDPQQRLFLECAWEALEHAGYPPSHSPGRVGVFAGAGLNSYLINNLAASEPVEFAGPAGYQAFISSDKDFLTTRVSYKLNLRGPSLGVQTACSTSLVAVALGCESLMHGQCDMVLAGGVAISAAQQIGYRYEAGMILAPDGHCRAFDAQAAGTVPGSGVGIVVLKRLSDALAGGDTIYAVIRGWAVNNDGAVKAGYTAPGVEGQVEVIRAAHAAAGIAPETIDYVEAHGTGTPLGDSIEIAALGEAFGTDVRANGKCAIGSVKTNIGHLDVAAGIAGLIKTALALHYGQIPPSLHFETGNPQINFSASAFRVNTALTPWPAKAVPRRAGVSSFGIGGTNAHVVLEESPERLPTPLQPARPRLVVLSAKSASALAELAARYSDALESSAAADFADVCFTASVGRVHFAHRFAVTARSAEEAGARLRALGTSTSGTRARAAERSAVAFLFSGQGAQYAGMGRALYDTQAVFRAEVDRCADILRPLLEHDLRDVLFAKREAALLDQTAYTQPALFALEWSLAQLWQSWGVRPAYVLGHSIGEYTAACVAGAISLEEGLQIVAARGRLMQSLPLDGAMVAIYAGEQRVSEALVPYAGRVSIAALNGPAEIVISGSRASVEAVAAAFQAEGVRTRSLAVSHAFHSPLMEPVLDAFEREVARVRFGPPRVGLVSNLTGALAGPDELADPAYWRRHARQPVRFADGIRTLQAQGCELFVEIGPRAALLGMARECLPEGEEIFAPSLRAGRDDNEQLLESLGQLYVHGVEIDWQGFWGDAPRRRMALPTYPFQRQRAWVTPSRRISAPAPGDDPLLGARLELPLPEIIFQTQLWPGRSPLLDGHRYYGLALVPAVYFLSMALSAANAALRGEHDLTQVTFLQALVLSDDRPRTVQVVLTPEGDGATLGIFSHDVGRAGAAGTWVQHVAGTIRSEQGASERAERLDREASLARCPLELSGEALYATLREHDIALGPSFQRLESIFVGAGEAIGRLGATPDRDQAHPYRALPSLIEAGLQLASVAASPALAQGGPLAIYAPIGVEQMRVSGDINRARLAYARLQPGANQDGFTGDVRLVDTEGQIVAELLGVRYRQASRAALRRAADLEEREPLYTIGWRPSPTSAGLAPEPGRWLILTDHSGAAAELVGQLESLGGECITVLPGPGLAELAAGQWQVDPGRADDLAQLVRVVAARAGAPWRGIVHLWGLDAGAHEPTAALDPTPGLQSALAQAQALVRLTAGPAPRLWIVTAGAQPAGDPASLKAPGQAPLWGLGRTIAHEYPELWGGLIDLEPGRLHEAVRDLAGWLVQPDGEDEMAWRAGQRLVPRLVRHATVTVTPPQFDSGSTYLITGGLGGLGLSVAGWMIDQGACHLVLAGRHDPSPATRERLRVFEQAGAQVVCAVCDVADEQAVAGLIASISATLPPLRGVVHAAGMLDDGVLLQQNWPRFAQVLAPKVAGAWHLHQHTRQLTLDFFILFSSAAGLLGSPGQASYAAANAFLDALAHHRRAQGLAACSLNWGPWAEIGMAARSEQARRHRVEQGIGEIAPEDGLRVLGYAINSSLPQIAMLPVDWETYRARPGAGRRVIAELGVQQRAVRSAPPAESPDVRLRLAASARERRDQIVALIQTQARRLLGLDPTRLLDPQRPLQELGLDSLMSIDMRNTLGAALGVSLPATLLFDYPTTEALCRFLEGVLAPSVNGKDDMEAGRSPAAEQDLPGDRLAQLSQSELEARLDERLEQLDQGLEI